MDYMRRINELLLKVKSEDKLKIIYRFLKGLLD